MYVWPWIAVGELSSRIFDHPWFKVRKEVVRHVDSGEERVNLFMEKGTTVLCVFRDLATGKLVLVEQDKFALKGRFVECPSGAWSQKKHAIAEDAVRAELLEEIGADVDHVHLQVLLTLAEAPNKTTGVTIVFYGEGTIMPKAQQLEDTEVESDLQIIFMTDEEALDAIDSGAITSVTTVAALLQCHRKGLIR